MPETYWLGGCACPPGDLAAALPGLLARAGLRLGQVPELHLMGSAPAGLSLPASLPVYAWPASPMEEHRLLHLMIQSVQAGQPEMVLLLEVLNGRAAAALLGSPAAAGRRNLLPLACLRIAEGHVGPGSNLRCQPGEPCGLQAEGPLFQLQQLVQRLQAGAAQVAMLQTLSGGRHLLATRLERI